MAEPINTYTEKVVNALNAHWHQDGFIGGFYVRRMRLEADASHEGHAHWINHMMDVRSVPPGGLRIDWRHVRTQARGSVLVLVPCRLLIKALAWHSFTSIGGTSDWCCEFAEAEAMKHYDTPVPYHLEVPAALESEIRADG